MGGRNTAPAARPGAWRQRAPLASVWPCGPPWARRSAQGAAAGPRPPAWGALAAAGHVSGGLDETNTGVQPCWQGCQGVAPGCSRAGPAWRATSALDAVQLLLNVGRDGLDLSAQLLLNLVPGVWEGGRTHQPTTGCGCALDQLHVAKLASWSIGCAGICVWGLCGCQNKRRAGKHSADSVADSRRGPCLTQHPTLPHHHPATSSHSQIDAVVIGDEVHCQPQVPKAAAAPNTVQVGLAVLGEVKVDDHIDTLDVNAAREQVCREHAQQVPKRGLAAGKAKRILVSKQVHTHSKGHYTAQDTTQLAHPARASKLTATAHLTVPGMQEA